MSEFVMPSLGADMEDGTLVEWLKEPGETVRRGDIVAVVETQKGAIEIEVFEDGVLQSCLVEPGKKVPVGTPLAIIAEAGAREVSEPGPSIAPSTIVEEVPARKAGELRPPQSADRSRSVSPQHISARHEQYPSGGGRSRITPAARRLAASKGVVPALITGSGPDGAIVLADVAAFAEKHLKEGRSESGTGPPTGFSGMRAAIATAMSRSKREIPHFYLSHTFDLTRAEAFVAECNTGREPGERILLAALFIKAVALAAMKYGSFNGHLDANGFQQSSAVHAGFAINIRGGGLVAPAIHNADTLDIDTLMIKMRDLVSRVRAGRFRASELADPTITISSLGERGVETLYGVIYPPQVAIVGFGMPVERPWTVNGKVSSRPIVTVTLAADHRVNDGHSGALFLNAIAKLLQEPGAL